MIVLSRKRFNDRTLKLGTSGSRSAAFPVGHPESFFCRAVVALPARTRSPLLDRRPKKVEIEKAACTLKQSNESIFWIEHQAVELDLQIYGPLAEASMLLGNGTVCSGLRTNICALAFNASPWGSSGAVQAAPRSVISLISCSTAGRQVPKQALASEIRSFRAATIISCNSGIGEPVSNVLSIPFSLWPDAAISCHCSDSIWSCTSRQITGASAFTIEAMATSKSQSPESRCNASANLIFCSSFTVLPLAFAFARLSQNCPWLQLHPHHPVPSFL